MSQVRLWRRLVPMLFVETKAFTRQIRELMPDDEYRTLQHELAARPNLGVLIPGCNGLRKLRWAGSGRGKRGGSRVIYYWAVEHHRILLLLVYPKSEQEDLSPVQSKILRRVVEEEFG